jgi:hypothetical protein
VAGDQPDTGEATGGKGTYERQPAGTVGSDWPFAPLAAGKLFAAELENHGLEERDRAAIERTNALKLFPRLGTAPEAPLSSKPGGPVTP